MRHLVPLLLAALLVLAGCGEPPASSTMPRGPELPEKRVRAVFLEKPECRRPEGASRWGCTIGPFRCQGVVTGRGWSVGCARPGESISFRVRPR